MIRVVCCGMLILGLLGCGESQEKKRIPLGHVYSASGQWRIAGEQSLHGLKLAVEHANQDAKDADQHPFTVYHVNAPAEKSAYAAEAVRLRSVNGVMAMIGGTTTRETEGLDQAGICVVSPSGLQTENMSSRVFLTGMSPQSQGQALAQFAAEQNTAIPSLQSMASSLFAWPGPGACVVAAMAMVPNATNPVARFFVLVDNRRPEHSAAAAAFENAIRKLANPSVFVSATRYYETESELTEQLQRLPKGVGNAIFYAGSPALLWQIRQNEGLAQAPIYFACELNDWQQFLDNRGMQDNVFLAVPWVSDAETKENSAFVRDFRAKFGQSPTLEAALLYDCARLLFASLQKVENGFTTKKIREKLVADKEFQGLTGVYQSSGQQTWQRPIFIVEVRQAQVQTLRRYDVELPKQDDTTND